MYNTIYICIIIILLFTYNHILLIILNNILHTIHLQEETIVGR